MPKKELPVLNGSKATYNCSECPAYCCTYDWINVNKRDIARLAKRFEIGYAVAEKRFTKFIKEYGKRVLRHKADRIYGSRCQFLDPIKRICTVYDSRPETCRTFPDEKNCGYYDFLQWERDHQDDPEFIPFEGSVKTWKTWNFPA